MDAFLKSFDIAHIGINCSDENDAMQCAEIFSKLLGKPIKSGSNSIFVGKEIEVMKTNYLGKNGHIALRTGDMEAALEALHKQGFEPDESTVKMSPEGKIKAIYLQEEVGGFAIHLLSE